ncbi:hypothetical protein IEO70_17665 [Bacillus sp. AGMB 02131]|uniref:Spore coat protein CotO n=1 Tax=Peribacillus faecalis TaxID=2772559 RepID=A0A927CYQ5_9BACI|nr:CotO family spore coat protein [Peribacillus faecalis]MBD3110163.1 hypothetical protein [Peribacillus faecalis]
MSKKSEENEKKPYMYIVQPEISPPDPNMQSQYRSIVGEDDIKVVEVEEGEAVSEIRILSSEEVEADAENNDDEMVVEMSTAVVSEEVIKEKPKKKSFSEMTKEEIMMFLAKMPSVVPRPVCMFTISGEKVRGQVEKQKGDMFLLRLQLPDGSELLQAKMEDIEHIEVENL